MEPSSTRCAHAFGPRYLITLSARSYMGISGFWGNELLDRTLLLVTEPKLRPAYDYVVDVAYPKVPDPGLPPGPTVARYRRRRRYGGLSSRPPPPPAAAPLGPLDYRWRCTRCCS